MATQPVGQSETCSDGPQHVITGLDPVIHLLHKTFCEDGWMPGSSPGMTMTGQPSRSRRYIGGFTPSAPTTTPPASGASFFMTTKTLRPTTSWSAGALTKETTVASVGMVIVCSPPL